MWSLIDWSEGMKGSPSQFSIWSTLAAQLSCIVLLSRQCSMHRCTTLQYSSVLYNNCNISTVRYMVYPVVELLACCASCCYCADAPCIDIIPYGSIWYNIYALWYMIYPSTVAQLMASCALPCYHVESGIPAGISDLGFTNSLKIKISPI